MKLTRPEIIAVFILICIGVYLRAVHLKPTAYFNADQEDFAWGAVRIIRQQKSILVGIKASDWPIFIGPGWYYVYALVYSLFAFDPMGLSYLHLALAALTLGSIFFVAKQIWGKRVGFFALTVYVFSYFFVDWDRRVWLPTPLVLVSTWVFYLVVSWQRRHQIRQAILIGSLLSLAYQLHLTGLLLWPLVAVSFVLHKVKFRLAALFFGLSAAVVGFLPVVLFDLRHEFLNTKGWLGLTSQGGSNPLTLLHLVVLARITLENMLRLVSAPPHPWAIILVALVFICWLVVVNKQPKFHLANSIIISWLIVPMAVFWLLRLFTPEYYFAITFPVLVFLLAQWLGLATKSRLGKIGGGLALVTFILINLNQLMAEELEDRLSLINKQRAVEYIIATAQTPDFSVNYLAEPGHNFGFNYLFYWKTGHTPPSSKTPNFDLVVPWDYQGISITQRFGAIGVVDHQQKTSANY